MSGSARPGRLSAREEEALRKLRDTLRESAGPERQRALEEIENLSSSLDRYGGSFNPSRNGSRQSPERPLDSTSYYKSTILTEMPPEDVLRAKPTSDEMKKFLSTQIVRRREEYQAREAPLQPRIDFEANNVVSCIGHEIRKDVPPIERERRELTRK
eukprot:gnl/Chilomastix_caulleri/2065.p1 GENE.gnl/Chilomastix_caulleri/2065~~gnl/Chilomastix_caulleri/2065.p1  ORF type:complete len:157 (+),score=37.45 gnl/Chilomastix_caulleri/2065:26-496(+)